MSLVADLMVVNPFDFFIEEYAERFPFEYEPALAADLAPYLRPVDDSDRAGGWTSRPARAARTAVPDGAVPRGSQLAPCIATSRTRADGAGRADAGRDARAAHRLVPRQRVAAREPPAPVRAGGALRVGLPRAARRRPGGRSTGPAAPTTDFTDLHAWAEVYVPGAGWVGLDPTSALFAGEGHIPLSATPHPSSAAPIRASTEPVEVTFDVPQRGPSGPRGPADDPPYTRQQWAAHRRARRGRRRAAARRATCA